MKGWQRAWSSWTVMCAWLALAGVPGAVHAENLTVHVIDIGGGLCTLTEAPGGHYMVYDAGVGLRAGSSNTCAKRIDQLMPAGAAIDVLILSHSDADHISSVARLLQLRDVHRVARTGHERDTKAWCRADYWIKVKVDGATR